MHEPLTPEIERMVAEDVAQLDRGEGISGNEVRRRSHARLAAEGVHPADRSWQEVLLR